MCAVGSRIPSGAAQGRASVRCRCHRRASGDAAILRLRGLAGHAGHRCSQRERDVYAQRVSGERPALPQPPAVVHRAAGECPARTRFSGEPAALPQPAGGVRASGVLARVPRGAPVPAQGEGYERGEQRAGGLRRPIPWVPGHRRGLCPPGPLAVHVRASRRPVQPAQQAGARPQRPHREGHPAPADGYGGMVERAAEPGGCQGGDPRPQGRRGGRGQGRAGGEGVECSGGGLPNQLLGTLQCLVEDVRLLLVQNEELKAAACRPQSPVTLPKPSSEASVVALHHAPAAEAVDAALLTLPPPGSSGFLRTAPDRNVRLAVRKLGTVERGKQGNRSDGLGVRAVPWPGHVDQTAAGNGKMEAADIEAMRQRMEKYRRKRASRALQRRKFGEDAA